MTTESEPTISQVVELWRRTFGEPPAILIEPVQMLFLIETHTGVGGLWREALEEIGA